MIEISKKHELQCGHRIMGHSGKCKYLHGHSYKFTFGVMADELDELGMIVDFSVLKKVLIKWLDNKFDHKMILHKNDLIIPYSMDEECGIIRVNYNPTVENLAHNIFFEAKENLIQYPKIKLRYVEIEETSTCKARYQNYKY